MQQDEPHNQQSIHYQAPKRNYLIPAALAVVFILPMIIAWYLFTAQHDWIKTETLNYGHLLNPPLQLSKLALENQQGKTINQNTLRGKWLMLYVAPKACDKICFTSLYAMRQIRLALGKNQQRVNRILLSLTPQLSPDFIKTLHRNYPGTRLVFTDKKALSHFMQTASSKTEVLDKGYFYLVDPLGNLMLSYQASTNPSHILKDMQRLMKTSRIG